MSSTGASIAYTLTVSLTITVVALIAYMTLGSIEILFTDQEDLKEKPNGNEEI
jgi:hypothetical protein